MNKLERKILKHHLKVMLQQSKDTVWLDSVHGDGDGIPLSLKGSLTKPRWQLGLWNSIATAGQHCSSDLLHCWRILCFLARKDMPPNSMPSGSKKERGLRHSQMELATQILWLPFSRTPLKTHYSVCIFKSYLATHGEGACVTLEELCSKEQNSG